MSSLCQAKPFEEAQRLSRFLQFPTTFNSPAFVDSFRFLQNEFPQTFKSLTFKQFGKSFLLTWQGQLSEPHRFLLSTHQDIFPANADDWNDPPFGGVIKQGKIFGRGAIDNKSAMLAILEGIEALLQKNFQPQNTLFFAFGADEESGGFNGARQMANFLKLQGIRLDAVFDEGGGFVNNPLPLGVKQFALIGITERNIWQINLKLHFKQQGHSALSQHSQTLQVLNELQRVKFPFHFEVVETFLTQQGIPQVLSKIIAPLARYDDLMKTILTSSIKIQSIHSMNPSQAQITLQIRGYPATPKKQIRTQIAKYLKHHHVVWNDSFENFQQTPDFTTQLAQVTKQGVLAKLGQVIQNTFHQKMILVPWITPASTDSRHYMDISDAIYRFIPITFHQKRLAQLHGVDEYITLEEYEAMLRFYQNLLQTIGTVNLFSENSF